MTKKVALPLQKKQGLSEADIVANFAKISENV